jgi:hypothetical protein
VGVVWSLPSSPEMKADVLCTYCSQQKDASPGLLPARNRECKRANLQETGHPQLTSPWSGGRIKEIQTAFTRVDVDLRWASWN